ncbi:MAG TPA: asparagine synthase-related protein [Blastocatellia bacterium]|nr:asparagine synthase-related protein [Blastocatellia bacterium]
MSAICGLIDLGGAPMDTRDWQEMFGALSHRGPDGSAVWSAPGAMLGHQMLRVTPDSFDDLQPWLEPGTELIITADARLDNREELGEKLGLSPTLARTIPDSRLILRAWQAWGESTPERLVGSFAFAIWDNATRRLFCCRDHFGTRSLYYFYDGRRFIFASEAKGILATPGRSRRLNAARLVAMLSPVTQYADHEQTLYREIYSLPAGTSMIVDADGLHTRTYWTPDAETEWPYSSEAEALEAFRELMEQVIRAQTRSAFPVGALLSGGLDSSSVVSVAARSLAAERQPLTTFSVVLPEGHPPGMIDEREFIDQFSDWQNLTLRYITDPQRGPFDNLEFITRQTESPFMSSRGYLYAAFAEAARASGIRVILNGDCGEAGPTSYAHGYYAELLLRLKWGLLARELHRRSRLLHAPLPRLVRSLVVGPVVRHLARQFTCRMSPPSAELPHAMSPRFVAEHLSKLPPAHDEMLKDQNRLRPDHRENERRFAWILYRRHSYPRGLFPGYEHLDMRLPFFDYRMLMFCRAAPGRLKVRDGYTRYLVRAGLDGILPPRIQWRTCKQPFSPDYQQRYEAQRAQARAILAEISPGDPVRAIVDVERLRRLVDHATPREAMHVVPSGIYLLFFLRQFSDFRR